MLLLGGRFFYVGECGVRYLKRPVGNCILHGQGESRQQCGFGQEVKIEEIEFEANDLENKIMSADLIRDNFKVLKDVYDHLTPDEKYDLLHLLVKKVVYFEEPEVDKDGKKMGKIKMDLWELPPIDPSKLSPAKGFAERNVWLPSADSNHGHGG